MARGSITEPLRELPVSGSYDVVVVGGGIAGVAAAVAAARAGASVCLLEKQFALGGLATLGNVTIWLPLCDGHGHQVSGGLAEELLKLSVADLTEERPAARFTAVPACWQAGGSQAERGDRRYQVGFNPGSYLLALETLVIDAGITLAYDTRVCGVLGEGRVTHLLVEDKDGRSAVACTAVIDATGDADVCWWAGEPTESLDTNVACGWFYTLAGDRFELHQCSQPYSPVGSREGARGPFFRGDTAAQVTAQILASRDLIRNRLAALRAQKPHVDMQLIAPPMMACLRMTRRLVGALSLGEQHVHTWFDDCIGFTGDWRRAGPVYALPLRALLAPRARNLLTAGRCISVDVSVWDVTRAIPGCVVTGQAAGAAAALAVQFTGGDVHELPVTRLQEYLAGQGVILDPERVTWQAQADQPGESS